MPDVEAPSLSPSGHTFEAKLGDREWFPRLQPLVYVNHAAVSPSSIPVRHAVLAALEDNAKHGVDAVPRWVAQRARLKGRLGELIGASAEDIALCANTTRAITDVAMSFPWEPGDGVVVFDGEFPANVTPWQRAAELFGLRLEMLSVAEYLTDEEAALARLEQVLAKGVRLVAVSAVQFQSGFRMPLAEMSTKCRAAGARLFVDGIQACGCVPLDVDALGIDFMACGSHKWLMGTDGFAFLYARRDAARSLRPHLAGWLSHDAPFGFLFEGPGHLRYDRPIRASIDFLEGGMANAIGAAALEASVDLILQLGPAAIFEHVNAFHDSLEAPLIERGFTSVRAASPARRSGILSVLPPDDIEVVELQPALAVLGVACSIPDGLLRFSPHWPNALDEADQILVSLDAALERLRGGGSPAPADDDW